LGAWKLMREGIIIKRSSIVETLGSTTVICTDKTGTITENSMQLIELYDFQTDKTYGEQAFGDPRLSALISYAMWSSEPVPFDPMEKTLHSVYEQTQQDDLRGDYRMFHEYPLEGKPPMMTHLFEDAHKNRIIAAKGAPQAILNVSRRSADQKERVRKRIEAIAAGGYRRMGVARSIFGGTEFPEQQQD